jgi:hypothetical protein
VVIASGRSDYSCDDNSSTPGTDVGSGGIDFPAFDDTPELDDTTVDFDVPTDDEWATGGYPPIGPDVSQPAGEPTGGQTPIGGWDNPADPLESTLDQSGVGYITGGTGTGGAPQSGDTLSVADTDFTCAGQVCWSKINKDTGVETDISCQDEPISGAWSLSITSSEIDHYIVAVGRCKDPSTPDGWGPPQSLGQTAAVLPPAVPSCGDLVSVTIKWKMSIAGYTGACVPDTKLCFGFGGSQYSKTITGVPRGTQIDFNGQINDGAGTCADKINAAISYWKCSGGVATYVTEALGTPGCSYNVSAGYTQTPYDYEAVGDVTYIGP